MIRIIVAAIVALAPISALAETVTFALTLDGASEVPPNQSTGKGQAEVTFDTESRILSWSIAYEGTTGPLIGGHVHGPAEAGVNAGVMMPFASLESPITGQAELTEAQAADLMSGKTYINLHTEAHPGGELRGQIVASH